MAISTSEKDTLTKRIDELLDRVNKANEEENLINVTELHFGILTLMVSVYGEESPQVRDWRSGMGSVDIDALKIAGLFAQGALLTLKADIDSGLVGDLQKRLAGEVLTEFFQLARAALDEEAKNVAAVLTAAVYEDTIRRMGKDFAGVIDRDKLSDVLSALKEKKILQGPQFGIAQSYLQFRNAALHADWEKIDKSSIESVLGFVQGLLLKHFS